MEKKCNLQMNGKHALILLLINNKLCSQFHSGWPKLLKPCWDVEVGKKAASLNAIQTRA